MVKIWGLLCAALLSGCTAQHSNTLPLGIGRSNTQVPLVYNTQEVALLLPGAHPHKTAAITAGFVYAKNFAEEAGLREPIAYHAYQLHNAQEVSRVYREAATTAGIVVGPLLKDHVQALKNMSSGSITAPVLLLNETPGHAVSSKVIEFSLNLEEEIQAIAEELKGRGLQQVLYISMPSVLGQRQWRAFQAAFQGRAIYAELKPEQDLGKQLKLLLQYQEHKGHGASVRQDIQAIVLGLNTEHTRQVWPLIKFYYAGHYPTFMTTAAYSGRKNLAADLDVEGLILCDMPFMNNEQGTFTAARAQADQHWPALDAYYGRLFALGMDAYALSQNLPALSQGTLGAYHGATGVLQLVNGKIKRQLQCATVKNRVVKE